MKESNAGSTFLDKTKRVNRKGANEDPFAKRKGTGKVSFREQLKDKAKTKE